MSLALGGIDAPGSYIHGFRGCVDAGDSVIMMLLLLLLLVMLL